MHAQTLNHEAVLEKTRELCQTIVSQPEFISIRKRVDSFMADATAQAQYQSLSERSHYLQHKQAQGLQLEDAEVTAFDKERDAFFGNPIAKDFMDAQEEMQQVQQSVNQMVTKTFELGRVPEETELDNGSCGHGCGCHH